MLNTTNTPYTIYSSGTLSNICGETLIFEAKDSRNDTAVIKYTINASVPIYGLQVTREILEIRDTQVGQAGVQPTLPYVPPVQVPVVDYSCKAVAPAGTYCLDQSAWRFIDKLDSNQQTGIWGNVFNPALCGVRSAPGQPFLGDTIYYPRACPNDSGFLQPGLANPYTPTTMGFPTFGSWDSEGKDPFYTATNAPDGQRCKIAGNFKGGQGYCDLGPNDQLTLISNHLLNWKSPSDAKQICIKATTSNGSKPPIKVFVARAVEGDTVEKTLNWTNDGKVCSPYDTTTRPLINRMSSVRIVAPSDTGLQVKEIEFTGVGYYR